MAENGVPISEISSFYWKKNYESLATQSPSGAEMLITDPETGKTHSPGPGEKFKNPTLAATFRELGEKGKKGFYEGRIAEAIVEGSSDRTSLLTNDKKLIADERRQSSNRREES